MNHEQKRCGKPNPRGGGVCILFPTAGHFHHRDLSGAVWNDSTPPVPNDEPTSVEQLAEDMRARVADLYDAPVKFVQGPVFGMAHADALLAELGPDPEPLTIVDAQLAELAQFVEQAQHSNDCYINPDETVCVCLIDRVRGLLPICGETRVGPTGEIWRCGEIRHPETPTQHHFLAV